MTSFWVGLSEEKIEAQTMMKYLMMTVGILSLLVSCLVFFLLLSVPSLTPLS